MQLSKAEAATCPVIRKLLLEYEAGAGMDNPTGLWSACEDLMFVLLWPCTIRPYCMVQLALWYSLIPGPKEEENGPGFSYLHIISD